MNMLAWLDRQSPLTGIALVLGTFVAAALVAAAGRVPERQPATALVWVYATPVPMPTADMRMAEEIAALRARVAELEASRNTSVENVTTTEPQPVYQVLAQPAQPTAGYVAHTTAGDIVVPPDATPVPAGAPYDGPFLAPLVTPPSGPRVCEGFGDFRDYDAMYQSSPACHKAP